MTTNMAVESGKQILKAALAEFLITTASEMKTSKYPDWAYWVDNKMDPSPLSTPPAIVG
jgi:hypothetical protein